MTAVRRRKTLNYRDPERLDAIFSAVRGVDDAKALIARGPEAIANRVYANRLGNGNEASGDGWRCLILVIVFSPETRGKVLVADLQVA